VKSGSTLSRGGAREGAREGIRSMEINKTSTYPDVV